VPLRPGGCVQRAESSGPSAWDTLAEAIRGPITNQPLIGTQQTTPVNQQRTVPTHTPTPNLSLIDGSNLGSSQVSTPVINKTTPKKTKDPERSKVRKALIGVAAEVKSKIKLVNQPPLKDTEEGNKLHGYVGYYRQEADGQAQIGSHKWQMIHGANILQKGIGACTDVAAATYYLIVTTCQQIFDVGYKVAVYWAGGHAYVIVHKTDRLPDEMNKLEDHAFIIDSWIDNIKETKVQKVLNPKHCPDFRTDIFYYDGVLKTQYPS
jgi:hypothetical protein